MQNYFVQQISVIFILKVYGRVLSFLLFFFFSIIFFSLKIHYVLSKTVVPFVLPLYLCFNLKICFKFFFSFISLSLLHHLMHLGHEEWEEIWFIHSQVNFNTKYKYHQLEIMKNGSRVFSRYNLVKLFFFVDNLNLNNLNRILKWNVTVKLNNL